MTQDKPLTQSIRARGGHVWVHCHGKVRSLIPRFIDMGVDVLNPLEPEPMGNVQLSELVGALGSAIGCEGNIETHDLWASSPERVEQLVIEAVAAGAPGGRFILCPSAGYMEFPQPTARYIENLMVYLKAGYREVCRYRQL
jgi:hypothetical protein